MSVGDDSWSVYRRYRRFRELHRNMLQEYGIVSNIEFPSRRYFGNKAEKFVRLRRAQLEVSIFLMDSFWGLTFKYIKRVQN